LLNEFSNKKMSMKNSWIWKTAECIFSCCTKPRSMCSLKFGVLKKKRGCLF